MNCSSTSSSCAILAMEIWISSSQCRKRFLKKKNITFLYLYSSYCPQQFTTIKKNVVIPGFEKQPVCLTKQFKMAVSWNHSEYGDVFAFSFYLIHISTIYPLYVGLLVNSHSYVNTFMLFRSFFFKSLLKTWHL